MLDSKINEFFDVNADIFPTEVDKNDGRFKIIAEEVRQSSPKKILDLGCGKGRFTKALKDLFPEVDYYGADISEKLLECAPDFMKKSKVSMLDTKYPDEYFDFIFTVEALEHAVDIEKSIKEMRRILKKGGKLVIIDKNVEKLGKLEITEWEQWFDRDKLKNIMTEQGFKTKTIENIAYNHSDGKDNLFIAWIGKKMNKHLEVSLEWIHSHTVENKGIAVSSKNRLPYPEVSGYFIPSLIKAGEKELALQYAKWLISIQNEDGSWSCPAGSSPYVFDTGQILKGLYEFIDEEPEFKMPILKACDWILSNMHPDGRLTTPNMSAWKLPNGNYVPESIHLYCLEPIKKIGRKFEIDKYLDAVEKITNYYLNQEDLTKFTTLSHFHAYIVEALIDLNKVDRAENAMKEIEGFQRENGSVPAYSNVDWVCSTGLFQYAVIWYKLGQKEKADKAFDYACSLQNETGGFFGGYGKGEVNYFPDAEISWVNKYFLDALHLRESDE